MFHADTHMLIDHWTTLSRRPSVVGDVPDRNSFHPDALGLRLPRLFMAEVTPGGARLRIAGSWI